MGTKPTSHPLAYDWLALPGIPAGSDVWENLSVRTLDFEGIQEPAPRNNWHLDSFVDEVLPKYDSDTVIVGHDFGGVIAAMSAVRKRPKSVVLTGTALGQWWFWTRLSAAPILNRFFYHTFKGNLFVRIGGGLSTSQRFANQPHFHDPSKMRMLAKNMTPPPDLVYKLSQVCPVHLIWGQREVFYPVFLAKSLSRQLKAPLYLNDGGHYCMWTHPEMFYRHMIRIETSLT